LSYPVICRQQKLEDVVQMIARQLLEVAAGSGDVSDQLTPCIYERVKEILSGADRMLDAFQVRLFARLALIVSDPSAVLLLSMSLPGKSPPEGHTEVIEKAISQDEKALGTLLHELGQADETTLKTAHEMGKSSLKPLPTPPSFREGAQVRRESTLPAIQEQIGERQQSRASTSRISEFSALYKEGKTHAHLSKRLVCALLAGTSVSLPDTALFRKHSEKGKRVSPDRLFEYPGY
jgi:hypothetical protein